MEWQSWGGNRPVAIGQGELQYPRNALKGGSELDGGPSKQKAALIFVLAD
jgi:hypothetical protein